MQLDYNFYNEMMNEFDNGFATIFGDKIAKGKSRIDIDNRGYFCMEYTYIPCNYILLVENELRTYDITIFDSSQASNSLYRITKFYNQLDKEGIWQAVNMLKSLLDENNFNFYFSQNGKLYRKNSEGIKRVKDLMELTKEESLN